MHRVNIFNTLIFRMETIALAQIKITLQNCYQKSLCVYEQFE